MQLGVLLEIIIEREVVSSMWKSRIHSPKVGAECAGLVPAFHRPSLGAWDGALPSNRVHPTTTGCCCQTQHGGRLTGALRKRPCPTFFCILYTAFPTPSTPLLITRTIQCITNSCSDIDLGSWIAAKRTSSAALIQPATLRVLARLEPVCGWSASRGCLRRKQQRQRETPFSSMRQDYAFIVLSSCH